MTIPVQVTLRTRDPKDTPLQVAGIAPCTECPLCVTLAQVFDHAIEAWRPIAGGGYYITHLPTGYQLGGVRFASEVEALAAIERCDWRFPAWAVATGANRDAAMLACRAKWRAAVPQWRE